RHFRHSVAEGAWRRFPSPNLKAGLRVGKRTRASAAYGASYRQHRHGPDRAGKRLAFLGVATHGAAAPADDRFDGITRISWLRACQKQNVESRRDPRLFDQAIRRWQR